MEDIKDFYDSLLLWKDLEKMYQLYPDHPWKYIHDNTKKRLENFVNI